MGTLALSTVSNCGMTLLSEELVHSTATCGRALRRASAASAAIFTPSRLPRPRNSPRSLPAFAGSMSTAATILRPLRTATCLATAAPMGPNPMSITRIATSNPPDLRQNPFPRHRQAAHPGAGGVEHGIGDHRSHVDDGRFAAALRREPVVGYQHGLDGRHPREARKLIGREALIKEI